MTITIIDFCDSRTLLKSYLLSWLILLVLWWDKHWEAEFLSHLPKYIEFKMG